MMKLQTRGRITSTNYLEKYILWMAGFFFFFLKIKFYIPKHQVSGMRGGYEENQDEKSAV